MDDTNFLEMLEEMFESYYNVDIDRIAQDIDLAKENIAEEQLRLRMLEIYYTYKFMEKRK